MQDISHENAAACSGGALTLWSEPNYGGIQRTYYSSTPNLGDLNNQASSFQIYPSNEVWRFYTGINYSGDYATVAGYGNFALGLNNNVESVSRLQ